MYANYLSENKLCPPVIIGGLWRTWHLLLSAGVRRYPPETFGGANFSCAKGLSNIRHPIAERIDTAFIYGGLRKKIYELEKKNSENTKNLLTCYTIYHIFQFMTLPEKQHLIDLSDVDQSHFPKMIRKAIIKRMNELNLNPNRLSEMLKDEIPRQTIYDFLSGKTDTRTEVVSALMKALDLEIKSTKKKKAR